MVCHGQHTYVYSQVLIQVLSQEPKGGFNMKRLSQEITKYALQKWANSLCISWCVIIWFIFQPFSFAAIKMSHQSRWHWMVQPLIQWRAKHCRRCCLGALWIRPTYRCCFAIIQPQIPRQSIWFEIPNFWTFWSIRCSKSAWRSIRNTRANTFTCWRMQPAFVKCIQRKAPRANGRSTKKNWSRRFRRSKKWMPFATWIWARVNWLLNYRRFIIAFGFLLSESGSFDGSRTLWRNRRISNYPPTVVPCIWPFWMKWRTCILHCMVKYCVFWSNCLNQNKMNWRYWCRYVMHATQLIECRTEHLKSIYFLAWIAQNAVGSNDKPADARLRRACREVHKTMLSERRYGHLVDTVFCDRGKLKPNAKFFL